MANVPDKTGTQIDEEVSKTFPWTQSNQGDVCAFIMARGDQYGWVLVALLVLGVAFVVALGGGAVGGGVCGG